MVCTIRRAWVAPGTSSATMSRSCGCSIGSQFTALRTGLPQAFVLGHGCRFDYVQPDGMYPAGAHIEHFGCTVGQVNDPILQTGPRSLIRTTTERSVLRSVTLTQEPRGSVRCAAVNWYMLYGSPLAVCLC